jgi:hypothetical protein
MASSPRWVSINGTASILDISPAAVQQMMQQRNCVYQLNGNTIQILLDHNSDRKPAYIIVKPAQRVRELE